jgi:hypothetical protein
LPFPLTSVGSASLQWSGVRVPSRDEVLADVTASLCGLGAEVDSVERGLSFSCDPFRFSWRRSPLSGCDGGEVAVEVREQAVDLHFELSFRRSVGAWLACLGGVGLVSVLNNGLSWGLLWLLAPASILPLSARSSVRQFGRFLEGAASGVHRAA